jgi:hypothetical protein
VTAFLSAFSQARDETTAAVILLACCLVALFMLLLTRGYQGTKKFFSIEPAPLQAARGLRPHPRSDEPRFGESPTPVPFRSGGDRAILGGGPSDEQLPSAEQRRVLALIAAFDVRHEGRR